VIWGKREGKYFCGADWTGGIALIRFDKFAVWRSRKGDSSPSSSVLRHPE
jgi:hypothetical protein